MSLAYYNEIDPDACAVLQRLIDDNVIAPGIIDNRSIEHVEPIDLVGFDQCHFFAGGACGQLPLGSQAGPTTSRSGPQAARAKGNRSRAKEPAQMIQGICGRTYIDSCVPSGPLSAWENRLRQRLARIGSTECALIWKTKTTPHGRLISRLARSTRLTNGTDSTGSPYQHAMWPTPKGSAAGESSRSGDRKDEPLLGGLMRQALWPTPQAVDGRKGFEPSRPWDTGVSLPQRLVEVAMWVTPSARDWKDSAGMATSSGDRSRLDQLPRQMVATDRGGQTPNGSSATTAKRGAPNPAFAFWLMGFPDEWVFGALQAMQSRQSSRRKSSSRISKRST